MKRRLVGGVMAVVLLIVGITAGGASAGSRPHDALRERIRELERRVDRLCLLLEPDYSSERNWNLACNPPMP